MTESTRPSRATRTLLAILALFVALSGAISGASAPPARAQDEPAPAEADVIVVLDEGADPAAVAAELGVEPTHVYEEVFTGFAAPMSAEALSAARADDQVQRIAPDGKVYAEAQSLSTGVTRVGREVQPGTTHLTIPSPIDADIAILDTGVNSNGDLIVAGGTSCVDKAKPEQKDKKKKKKKKRPALGDKKARKGHGDKKNRQGHGDKKNGKGHGDKKNRQNAFAALSPLKAKHADGKNDARHKKHGKSGHDKNKAKHKDRQRNKDKPQQSLSDGRAWADDNGHGTHVAGIAAAIDNEQGVVGVAPGARVWAVKVLDEFGSGSFSDVICGLDWVVSRQATIDVVNLSLSGAGSDGSCVSSALHNAICNVVNAGIPVVVAAGNQGTDASTRVPASYDEVITVGAFSDSDGQQGKLGPEACFGPDDTYLNFSNFGADIDVAAPGDCILSLTASGGTRRLSGTSEASPHVVGALAWYIASQVATTGVRPTPQQSRTWLETQASESQDGIPYPVLWLDEAIPAP